MTCPAAARRGCVPGGARRRRSARWRKPEGRNLPETREASHDHPRNRPSRQRVRPGAAVAVALRLLILTQLAFNIGFFAVPALPLRASRHGHRHGRVAGRLRARACVPSVSRGCSWWAAPWPTATASGRWCWRAARCGSPASPGWATRSATWTVIGAVLLIGFAAALFSPAVESEVARQAVAGEEAGPRFPHSGSGAVHRRRTGRRLRRPAARRPAAGRGLPHRVPRRRRRLRPRPGRTSAGRCRSTSPAGPAPGAGRTCAPCCATGASSHCAARTAPTCSRTTSSTSPCPRRWSARPARRPPLAWLFALSSLLVVTAQLPITRWAATGSTCAAQWSPGCCSSPPVSPSWPPRRPGRLDGRRRAAARRRVVVLLTLGQMLVVPAARAWVPDLADEGRIGLYTGALSSVSGADRPGRQRGRPAPSSTRACRPRCPGWCSAAVPLAAIAVLPRRA